MEPLIWLAILAGFLVIEAVTVGLTTIWFAGGALVAAVASFAGAGLVLQLLLFFAVSLVLLIFTRPAAVRFMNKDLEKTNVNSLIGKKAVVTQEIDNLAQKGQVRINDIDWMARAVSDGERIAENAIVRIKEVNGVRLIVEKCKEE